MTVRKEKNQLKKLASADNKITVTSSQADENRRLVQFLGQLETIQVDLDLLRMVELPAISKKLESNAAATAALRKRITEYSST